MRNTKTLQTIFLSGAFLSAMLFLSSFVPTALGCVLAPSCNECDCGGRTTGQTCAKGAGGCPDSVCRCTVDHGASACTY